MFKVQNFKQSNLAKPGARGVCFRVSYKWVSCKIRNQNFKFMGLNADKTYAKQLDYLREPDCVRLEDQAGYSGWALAAHRNDEHFIDTWGKNHGDLKCTPHRVISVEDAFFAEDSFVYCFYGTTATGGCWGHAVAVSGPTSRFFDSNYGEYRPGDNENFARAIDTHCNAYAGGGKQIVDRYTYVIKQAQ